MRGSFDLLLLEETATQRACIITNLSFVARSEPPTTITGHGTLRVDADGNQQMVLNASVNGQKKVFTNDILEVTLRWPMIGIHVLQTEYNLFSFDSMDVIAAPMRELWFGTGEDFFSTNLQRTVSGGDLLSNSGRVVKDRSELLAAAGIPGSVALDTVTVRPGAEVLFSLQNDAAGGNGPVRHGDALSARGGTVFSNPALTVGFEPQQADTDLGLDALYVADDGQIYFSTVTNFISPNIGLLSHGDVLAYNPNGDGVPNRLVKTRQQLLSTINPVDPALDPGLDALYVWSSGEIWFSTAQPFSSLKYGPISEGDLLSDQGLIIFRGQELIEPFATAAMNRGLRAVFVITDVSGSNAAAPHISSVQAGNLSGDVILSWAGSNRVTQVERANAVTGVYLPASQILPEIRWTDAAALRRDAQSFYRLRWW